MTAWHTRDRELAARSRLAFRREVVQRIGNGEVLVLPRGTGKDPSVYVRERRRPNREGKVSPVTMPWRRIA